MTIVWVKHTARSCREWRTRRNTGASGTSWGQCTRGTRRHPRYHLHEVSPTFLPLLLRFSRSPSRKCGRRTDGGRLDHVADGESLDCLVLGCASRAVGAADGLDVAATLLVTAAVVVLVLSLPRRLPFRWCILRRALLDHVGLISGNCKRRCRAFED